MGMWKNVICLIIVAIGFQAAGLGAYAQSWNWATGMQSLGSTSAFGIATDAAGNSYTTGFFEGNADFGNGISLNCAGQRDLFVAKYGPAGTPIWAIRGGMDQSDYGQEIAVDNNGFVYVTGTFTDSLRLATAMGSIIVYAAGERDVFLAKLDANTGNAVWLTAAGGPSSDEGTSVTVMGTKIFVAGFYDGTANFDMNGLVAYGARDAFVACYDELSNSWTWAKSAGTAAIDLAWGICNDGTNIYVTGQYDGAVFNFGTTSLGGFGLADGFITKLDPNGLTLWSANLGGAGQNETPTAIVSDGTDVYVTGNVYGQNPVQFRGNPTVVANPPGAGIDFWTCKFSGATGQCQWALAQGGAGLDVANGITVTGQTILSIAGSFENSVMLGGTPWTGPGREVFVESIDAVSGTPTSSINATGPGTSVIHDIDQRDVCSIFAAGEFDQTTTFSTHTIVSATANNGFAAVFNPSNIVAPTHDMDSAALCFGDSLTIHLTSPVSSVAWEFSTDNGATWQPVVGAGGDSIRIGPSVTTWYRSNFSGACFAGKDTTWVGVGGLTTVSITGLPDSSCLAGNAIPFTYGPCIPMGALSFSPLGFSNLGNGNASFDPSVAGIGLHFVNYDFSDSFGCRVSAADTVSVYSLPSVSFVGLNQSYCQGDTVGYLLAGNLSPFGTFLTSDSSVVDLGNGNALYYPGLSTLNDTTWISYGISDNNGCVAIDSQWTYLAGLPLANAGPDHQICQGDSVVLGSPAVIGEDYLWSGWGTGWSSTQAQPTLFPTNSGTCVVTVQNVHGCTDKDTVDVLVIPFPTANAGLDQIICQGDSVTIGGFIPQGYVTTWQSNLGFQSNLGNPVTAPLQTETFVLTLTDSLAGCSNSDFILVTVVAPALPADAGPDQSLTAIGTVNLSGSDPQPGQGQWICPGSGLSVPNPFAANTTLDLSAAGTWTMVWQVTNSPCPASKDSMTITVTLTELRFPTGFSPNDDQVNDKLIFDGLENYPENKLHIFNRWGVELLTFAPYHNDWDGTNSNGQPLVDDTYYYVLELEEGNSVNNYVVLKR